MAVQHLPVLHYSAVYTFWSFVFIVRLSSTSDLIIPGLVTNGTAKICCLGLVLALFYRTMVIGNDFEV